MREALVSTTAFDRLVVPEVKNSTRPGPPSALGFR